jgi:hypothetical protein
MSNDKIHSKHSHISFDLSKNNDINKVYVQYKNYGTSVNNTTVVLCNFVKINRESTNDQVILKQNNKTNGISSFIQIYSVHTSADLILYFNECNIIKFQRNCILHIFQK